MTDVTLVLGWVKTKRVFQLLHDAKESWCCCCAADSLSVWAASSSTVGRGRATRVILQTREKISFPTEFYASSIVKETAVISQRESSSCSFKVRENRLRCLWRICKLRRSWKGTNNIFFTFSLRVKAWQREITSYLESSGVTEGIMVIVIVK